MDFTFSAEQDALRAAVREVVTGLASDETMLAIDFRPALADSARPMAPRI